MGDARSFGGGTKEVEKVEGKRSGYRYRGANTMNKNPGKGFWGV